MLPESTLSTDRLDHARPPQVGDGHHEELFRLRAALEQMTSYAQALEECCHRLWTYVPDTHGSSDPVLPFVARYCDIVEPGSDGTGQSGLRRD
jgi:hypothetical protein